ncbi:polysaccharide pyruvyl transferase family protein [Halomonas sp. LR5S13]|uniref:polysaccharide pyruvyl transferase family protein n=1 Tax=Halomonas rhizosphaerae TaxID=3043296 RepID=UPI0024A9B13B|nr:polysaccharide pyruvyl transferase family protein [Halomonas rhizosphaerae]MDI5921864.1 polysaccharide pyruvyl transferase family protein [Halomonas rhizosphaerae]
MLNRIRMMPKKLATTSRLWRGEDVSVLRWATKGIIDRNWGDKLNPYMAERISCRPVIHRADVYPFPSRPVHYWIGSHLATACRDPNAVIWGTGFISADDPISGRPREIHAVRGWLSNERLRKKGLSTPDIVGDPALLLPRLYEPKNCLDRRSLGIIPHCYEWDEPFFAAAREWQDVRMIDICGDIEDVIEQIVSCDRVISSSLHGIICADAYNVPSLWIHVSDKPKGDGFKFRDYFSSVGRPENTPIIVDVTTPRDLLEKQFYDYRIDINLDALWQVCPLRPAAS